MYKRSKYIIILLFIITCIFVVKKVLLPIFKKNIIIAYFVNDWTVTKPITSKNQFVNKTWVVSFATRDTFTSAQKALNFSVIKHGFKKIINYNENDIVEFEKQNPNIFQYQKGYGLWSWKSYLILETLKQIPEGDIIFYLDSASIIHDDLSAIFKNFEDKDVDMIFFSHTWPEVVNKNTANKNNHILCNNCSCSNNSVWTKKLMMDKLKINKEDFLNDTHKIATLFILRNTSFTREFIRKWLKMCINEELISSLSKLNNPNNIKKEHACFLEHKEDEGILNGLIYLLKKTEKNKIKILKDSDFINWNSNKRFFSKNNIITLHSKKKLKKSLIKFLN